LFGGAIVITGGSGGGRRSSLVKYANPCSFCFWRSRALWFWNQ
jgi:hypothetical protein